MISGPGPHLDPSTSAWRQNANPKSDCNKLHTVLQAPGCQVTLEEVIMIAWGAAAAAPLWCGFETPSSSTTLMRIQNPQQQGTPALLTDHACQWIMIGKLLLWFEAASALSCSRHNSESKPAPPELATRTSWTAEDTAHHDDVEHLVHAQTFCSCQWRRGLRAIPSAGQPDHCSQAMMTLSYLEPCTPEYHIICMISGHYVVTYNIIGFKFGNLMSMIS